ncbi:hypothetical protein [Pedobacter sp. SYSU D00535]|uniref:hypothetical protein n=1 Tax=Pedobacter sp. SYSU D00535 TaxID=2810308 RepID=UPI001A95AF09|nr:hypothetical protein [Pedobacter sp. SYSU D00535]
MFNQILDVVKQQIGSNQEIKSSIPPGKEGEVETEIAHGVQDGLKNNLSSGGIGGLLSSFTGGSGSGNISSAIAQAVASRLNGKFGLSPEAVSKITSAIPGIVQRFLPG